MLLFRIKICGVTRTGDAVVAAEAGADAIGLNFYSGSRRFITNAQAAEIIASLPKDIVKVGVFVNASAAEIRQKVESLGLDWVQLHGDEPPETVEELGGISVLRAIRMQSANESVLPKLRSRGGALTRLPSALLIDAYSATEYGGTGETADWSAIARIRQEVPVLPIVLAGGLTAYNVAAAIRAARPDAVDTASGVESSPGIKDHAKMRAFVEAAKAAFGL